MKIWVNGTFDVLHIGHIELIKYADSLKGENGHLRIGIDTDERVREKKGEDRPYNTLEDRMEFMSSIKFVDSVVSFDSDDSLIKRIKEYEPDILVIGDDYKYHQIIGIEYVPKVMFFEKIEGKSSSKILNYGNNSNR
jgi:D-beta-D-heptose 7-phosphate kinase/D-beta-D-heptose 1-phosphate adenosyltransferase